MNPARSQPPARVLPLVLLLLGSVLAALPARAQSGGDPSPDAMKMGSPPSLPAGTTSEEMWPAPTAEDWERPCLVTFQRSFDDALRVANRTGKPMLVCVNMDGEPASEHFAGIRYRQEETARLLEPYVCLAASVYRHTQRDYDEQGNRVLCPRLGSVTCGEHIAVETELYAKYFEGKRIAPRHILLERDGTKTWDVFYSWDTQSVFTAWRKGAENRPPPPPRGDLSLDERTASADIEDRVAIEQSYRRGSRQERRELLESAYTHREVDQIDLLRLAIFGLDVDLARLARKVLARSESEAAVDLIAEALKLPMDEAEREELLAAAVRLGDKYPRARTLVAVRHGLAAPSKWVDVQSWTQGLEAQYRASAEAVHAEAARLDTRAAEAEAKPADAEARLAFAESLLAHAADPTLERRYAELLFADAASAALEAERLGARGWRVDAALAVTAAAAGNRPEAIRRAQSAMEGGMPRPGSGAEGLQEGTAVTVLALFAQARQQAIAKAYRERASWPPEWLADIHAAYAVLARHPLGTDQNVADGYDFLMWLGATPRATATLEEGLARFPESWLLHERLRGKLLWEKGPEGLEAAYTTLLAEPNPAPGLEWFAGLASIVAAENLRRAGEPDKALAAYERGIAHYQRDLAAHPDHRESVDHYVALAEAGQARVEFEHGRLEDATRSLLAAFERSPTAAAALDGLGITPIDTGRALLTRLEREEQADLADRVQAGFDRLDPRLLDLPDAQRGVPNEGARAETRRRRTPPDGG